MLTVRKGSRNNDVKVLQERLNTLGFKCGKADGIFGTNTEVAVKKFQDAEWLYPDGIVGAATWAALENPGQIKHFTKDEFRCKHCGQLPKQGIDRRLVLMLETLRTQIGNKPIIITSGYRCPTHNKATGGAGNSQHMYGKAVDILVKGMSPRVLEVYCDKLFANDGVGLGGATIVHVDTRGHRSRWRYN
jgi:zinc D-Ala-D-Ala carboxypeptidase